MRLLCEGAVDKRPAQQLPGGLKYEGEWLADHPCGQGRLTLQDGSTWAGQWWCGLRHGEGELSVPAAAHWSAQPLALKGEWRAGLPWECEGMLPLRVAELPSGATLEVGATRAVAPAAGSELPLGGASESEPEPEPEP